MAEPTEPSRQPSFRLPSRLLCRRVDAGCCAGERCEVVVISKPFSFVMNRENYEKNRETIAKLIDCEWSNAALGKLPEQYTDAELYFIEAVRKL
jgi:hypothetical protein